MRDDRLRFSDMYEAITKIEKYTSAGKQSLSGDELVQVWVVHNLQILGEAARGVSQDSQEKYSRIPWGKIIGFRNILVHHYFAINSDELWAVVEVNLPPLKTELEKILNEIASR